MRRFHIFVVMLCLLAPGAGYAQTVLEGTVDDVTESPVFFEMHSDFHSDPANLNLFREGKIRLYPLGVFNIEGFNWRTHERRDQSFWIRMERGEYMCPILDSDTELDRDLVRAWYTGWLDAHEGNMHPNVGTRDAMGVGMRAMMLTRYIRHLELEEPEQQELIDRLRAVIPWHQEYLRNPRNFNTTSNHGMWESMGLFESTRVVPDSALTILGLQRLLTMSRTGVSKEGLEKEHSIGYHYYFYNWLSQFTSYLESLKHLGWSQLPELLATERRMRDATWYMYDHRQRMAQIGDTDNWKWKSKLIPRPPDDPDPAIFDAEAGLAIYKERGKHRRYVIFNIQNEAHRPHMAYHLHNDMMAVYYSDDGEVLLGDGGRFSYSNSQNRRFFLSSSAHNVIMPYQLMVAKPPSGLLAKKVWEQRDDGDITFNLEFAGGTVTRSVEIPRRDHIVRVRDNLNVQGHHVILWNLGMDVAGFGIGDTTEEDGGRSHRFLITTRYRREFDMTVRVTGVNNAVNEVDVLKGSDNPMLGWYAPDYNQKWPVPVVVVNIDAPGAVEVVTEIEGR